MWRKYKIIKEIVMYGEVQGTGFDRIDPHFDACLTGHGALNGFGAARAGWKARFGLPLDAIF